MKKHILLSLLFINTLGCKNILTELEQSQVTGLLSASFDTPVIINNANQNAYVISGFCGKNGSTIDIQPGVGTTTCSNGRFSYTTDMSGYADGDINLSLDASFDTMSLVNTASQDFTKDALVPMGTYLTVDRDDPANAYVVSGDCNKIGSTITISYLTFSQSTTCTSGSFSMTLDLSAQIPTTPVLPSEFILAGYTPQEVAEESSDYPIIEFAIDHTPAYTSFNLNARYHDSANNSSISSWPAEINSKVGFTRQFTAKTGLSASTNCNDFSDYNPTVHNFGGTNYIDKIGMVNGDSFKLCVRVIDDQNNNIVYEKTWDIRSYPRVNNYSCSRSASIASGAVACYGVHDYGNSFGEDSQMCESSGMSIVGCNISTSACVSGTATATAHIRPSQLPFNDPKLIEFNTNFASFRDLIRMGISTVWEYTCD